MNDTILSNNLIGKNIWYFPLLSPMRETAEGSYCFRVSTEHAYFSSRKNYSTWNVRVTKNLKNISHKSDNTYLLQYFITSIPLYVPKYIQTTSDEAN